MSLMICLKYTKLSAEVLFGKMRLKYNFTSFTIHCEMSVIKKKIAMYMSCCLGSTPFLFLKTSRHRPAY